MTITSRAGRFAIVGSLCAVALAAVANSDAIDPAALTAGSFTTPEQGPHAFSLPIAALDKEQAQKWAAGKEQFNEAWVVAPEPGGVWGLGPTFNEDRCAHCHVENGRAKAADDGHDAERGLLVRLSVKGQTKEGAPLPHPVYGDQFQNRGMLDRVPAEGRVVVAYASREVTFADGEKIVLRVPQYKFEDLHFGELGADTLTSPRVAPAMIGLGITRSRPRKSDSADRRTAATRAARQTELRVGLRERAEGVRAVWVESEPAKLTSANCGCVSRRHRGDDIGLRGRELSGGAEAMSRGSFREQVRRARWLQWELSAGSHSESAEQHHAVSANACGACTAECWGC